MKVLARLAGCSWQALGTSAVLVVTDDGALTEARAIVERELDRIDRACSRFRTDSELSRVNADTGTSVSVSPLFLGALEVALRAARLTDGAVDPTVGMALELAGYDRDWELLRPPNGGPSEPPAGPSGDDRDRPSAPTVRARLHPGWRAIAVDARRSTVRVPTGVKLDLGATAKAWAADRAARAIHQAIGTGALVSLGGDIATCGLPPERGWQVYVTDDHRAGPTAPGQTITISGGGLATSSTAVRRWSHRGTTMHHVIDPATGAPTAGPWRTVSVAAVDCTDANIASTGALVLGGRALQWLTDLGVPARLVSQEGNVLTVGGWPSEAREAQIVPRHASPSDRRLAA